MAASTPASPPLAKGLLANFRYDFLSGFLVFLIALPLCLGIASASKFPPIAGIWTAVIGGILCTLLSNSPLTIKGPAAGLIVIVEGAVLELGKLFAPAGSDLGTQALVGYPLALGVGLTAGIIQILFGLIKAGKLAEIVPLTPVHGMLAAIGVTIMAKQFYRVIGLNAPDGEPINAILALPESLASLNPVVAAVGFAALAILIVFPFLKARLAFLKPVPAQVVVLAVAIPLSIALGLPGMLNEKGDPQFMVNVKDILPAVFGDYTVAFMVPDFRGVMTDVGLKYVVLFALVGSIESLLSAKAIDLIDPWKRKTDMNRDLVAVGIANTLCAAVGALPMISEIVRSKANVDNGGRTKFANLYHGLFLLAVVLAAPFLIRMFPLSALGAMLVYTGFRLASPREFFATWTVGKDQFIVFVATILVTLCTDLLIGIVAGIALKVLIHLMNGAPLSGLWKADVDVVPDGETKARVVVRRAALFPIWLGLHRAITAAAAASDHVEVDLSRTRLVDHSVMEKLHELEVELAAAGKHMTLTGLDGHKPLSEHPLAARRSRKGQAPRPAGSGERA